MTNHVMTILSYHTTITRISCTCLCYDYPGNIYVRHWSNYPFRHISKPNYLYLQCQYQSRVCPRTVQQVEECSSWLCPPPLRQLHAPDIFANTVTPKTKWHTAMIALFNNCFSSCANYWYSKETVWRAVTWWPYHYVCWEKNSNILEIKRLRLVIVIVL